MPATINVNFRTVVHKDSGGMCMGFPDVCKTPAPPAGPIPIPYPNIAQSQDTNQGSTSVKMDGNPIMLKGSVFAQSSGDEAGSVGGLITSVTKGKAEFFLYSFDVQVEGKGVCRLGDIMGLNKSSPGGPTNTPPFPLVQPPLVALPMLHQPDDAKDWGLSSLAEDAAD